MAVFSSQDIAIIGFSGRFPQSDDVSTFWERLRNKTCSLARVPSDRWRDKGFINYRQGLLDKGFATGGFLTAIDHFDTGFFGLHPEAAMGTDPEHRLFLEESWAALEHAGYGVYDDYASMKFGAFVGGKEGDYALLAPYSMAKPVSYLSGKGLGVLASRLSYFLNAKGYSVGVDAACVSFLMALKLACDSLKEGTNDMALAGAVSLFSTPRFFLEVLETGWLSTDGRCRSLDMEASGYVPSEGVGAVVLKRYSDAVSDGDTIYGLIKDIYLCQSGRTNGISSHSLEAQTQLYRDVYEERFPYPEKIGYIEAHGTGTVLGDQIELTCLRAAFDGYLGREKRCPLGCLKEVMGYGLGTSSFFSLIKGLMMFKEGVIPGGYRKKPPISLSDSSLYLVEETEPLDKEACVAINCFGFNGTLGHLIIGQTSPAEISFSSELPYLVVFSDRSEMLLNKKLLQMQTFLDRHGDTDFLSLVYTLLLGRTHYPIRKAFVVTSIEDLKRALDEALSQDDEVVTRVDRTVTVDDLSVVDGALSFSERQRILEGLGACYMAGKAIDWAVFFPDLTPSRIGLPTQPYSQQSYWYRQSEEPLLEAVSSPIVTSDVQGQLLDYFKSMNLVIGPTLSFVDQGLTSVQALRAIVWINQRFGLQLEPIIFYEYPNIELLSNYISEGRKVSV